MDLLKRIRQKIDEFCFNHMRMDGAQHLIAGILIYDVLKYLIPVWSAILITLIILVAKEVVLDKWIRKGVADWHDIIWGGLSLKPWGIALKFLFLHHENILFPND